MSPEEEISGLKRLCASWREDCHWYASGLREARKMAMQMYDISDFESDNWLELIEYINSVLAFDGKEFDATNPEKHNAIIKEE